MTPPVPPPAPFVIGVGRSGTTLLRLMLDAHPAMAIPGETHFVPGLLQAVSQGGGPAQAVALLESAETWPNLGLPAARVAQAFEALRPFTAEGAVRTLFGLYAARFGKRRWGDKTPGYRRALQVIARALPEARFIHMIRDGRDVALSHRGLWFGPGDSVEAQARFWVDEIAEARRQAQAVPHYLEVRYEDLVREPEATLRRVCGHIDLPFDPAMLAYQTRAKSRMDEHVQTFGPQGRDAVTRDRFLSIHERTQSPPDSTRIGRWRSGMTEKEAALYSAIAGPLLAELGYPGTDDAPGSRVKTNI